MCVQVGGHRQAAGLLALTLLLAKLLLREWEANVRTHQPKVARLTLWWCLTLQSYHTLAMSHCGG